MAREIWKYPLQIADTQTLKIPAGKPIAVHMQNHQLCLWAEVTPGASDYTIQVDLIGTGNPFNGWEVGKYLGTVLMASDALVWHVYTQTLDPHTVPA